MRPSPKGEVAEAFQMAVLKQLPIIYLVQDNEWDISASADEIRVGDASEYAKGFKGLEVRSKWMATDSSPAIPPCMK
jgi:TPP-dependent pyruvate/acetoin dehydrogenase alpha subunit